MKVGNELSKDIQKMIELTVLRYPLRMRDYEERMKDAVSVKVGGVFVEQ